MAPHFSPVIRDSLARGSEAMVARKQRAAGTQAETAASPTQTGSRKGATQSTSAAPVDAGTNPVADPAPKEKATRKESASRPPAPVKLTDRQKQVLQKIQAAGPTGYEVGQKAEQRTLDALADRKLIKRGPK